MVNSVKNLFFNKTMQDVLLDTVEQKRGGNYSELVNFAFVQEHVQLRIVVTNG